MRGVRDLQFSRKCLPRRILDAGEKPPTEINVNDACDLFKIFFRELPQNILPDEHFATHISISDMNNGDGTEDKLRTESRTVQVVTRKVAFTDWI